MHTTSKLAVVALLTLGVASAAQAALQPVRPDPRGDDRAGGSEGGRKCGQSRGSPLHRHGAHHIRMAAKKTKAKPNSDSEAH